MFNTQANCSKLFVVVIHAHLSQQGHVIAFKTYWLRRRLRAPFWVLTLTCIQLLLFLFLSLFKQQPEINPSSLEDLFSSVHSICLVNVCDYVWQLLSYHLKANVKI